MPPLPLPRHVLDALLERALAEDLGEGTDLTTSLLVEGDLIANAAIISRVDGVLAGGILLAPLFARLDARVRVWLEVEEGGRLSAGATIARLEGPAAAILTGERVALNLAARASGVATLTRRYVERAGPRARIADTRKTTPGLRALERYAVRCGGGHNHRFNLADGVLIKDNHLAVSMSVADAVRRARAGAPHPVRLEVEVETVEQAREAREAGADILLLDNMSLEAMRQVVEEHSGHVLLEASGGVTLERVADIAATGVDVISVGALTHSAASLDLSLEMAVRASSEAG
ncbi:MAG: carboxylating nicotinate-nucleotide diphosphorylase [Candidatus Riflebacteria bacterium]|nr:carboxylating nicotinate-nucleotide diphosphorylase [Candidatus Riflebacteria bacterium]